MTEKKKLSKVLKTLKVLQSSKTSIQISSLKQLILIILKKTSFSESEYTLFADKFIFMGKEFLSYWYKCNKWLAQLVSLVVCNSDSWCEFESTSFLCPLVVIKNRNRKFSSKKISIDIPLSINQLGI